MVFTVTSSNCQVKIARFYEFFRLQNSPYFCVFKYARAVMSNKRSGTRLKKVSPTPGVGGTPIHYLYGYVPPNGAVILKLLRIQPRPQGFSLKKWLL